MYKIIEIIKKNIRLLIRSKGSALIILVGPLALILLISLAFNTSSLYDIKIGAYSESYSELSNDLIDKLNQDEFKVTKIDSQERCINSIKTNDLHVCMVFPKDLALNTEGNLEIYVDKTRVNIVWLILNSISSKISTKSTELSTALTNTLLSSLDNTQTKLTEDSPKIIQISASLSDIKTKVNDLYSDLNSLDLGSNITQIKNEVSNIQSETNLSSETFSTLNSLVDSLEANYEIISSITQESTSSLSSIKSDVEEDIIEVSAINENINAIIDDINKIEIKEVTKIVSPISTEIKPITSEEATHLNYTFPTLLVLVLLFAGLLIGSTTVIEEKSSKAYFRNFITPTNEATQLSGNYLSNLIIIIIQLIIIFIVMLYITDIAMSKEVLTNVIIALLLISSVFIFLGMLIGYLFKTGETSNIAAITLACILLFFSNTILPIETLPTAIRSIVNFNPFIIGEKVLKELLIFNSSLNTIATSLYYLLGLLFVLVVLTYLSRQLTKRWI